MKNQAVLITGAAKRLGMALTRKSLAMGFSVLAHYRSSKEELEQWLEAHPDERSKVHFMQAELTTETGALMARIDKLPVKLVGLVNNASVYARGSIDEAERFNALIDTNAFVPLLLAREFRKRARAGWIINITDAHIDAINHEYQSYRIAKKLLGEFTMQLASLYAPDLRVNAVAPGAMLPAPGQSPEVFDRLSTRIPLGRTGSFEDLWRAYEYLVKSDYVTGQVLYVDGGWHLRV
ncbi:MAG: SDR family oxidoreductase [Chitinivibrionales bacterium]|nr:SDR family oxidoreductase [Chitinivibrionales bacterium]MBD3357538.1 SDR family oxidoreductase [Chitinivibrionales bacterium]